MQKIFRITIVLLTILVTSSCSIRKHVPEGKSLLIKNKIVVTKDYKEISTSDISKHVTQKAMPQLFGWMPFVNIYYRTAKKTDKKFYKWVNEKIGRKPVYYSEKETRESEKEIERYLSDIGFFKSKVVATTKIRNNRAKVKYTVYPSKPYKIENVRYKISDDSIAGEIKKIEKSLPVKTGGNYNAYKMDDERDVITNHMRDNGYYFFTKETIIFEVDTNFMSHRADVTLRISGKKHYKYLIDNIFIYPNYKHRETHPADTVIHTFSLGRKGENVTFRFVSFGNPKINFTTFNQVVQMHPLEEYSSKKVSQTYHTLGMLPIYSSTNIRFDTIPSSKGDTIKHLNCDIYLQKGKLNYYNLQLEGTNSAGNFGALGSVTYRNNNIFHGSEVLNVKVKGGYQLISTADSISPGGHFHGREFGVETSISFPRFLGPLNFRHFVREYQPKTIVNVGYDTRRRPLYRRQTALVNFGYNWMTSEKSQHILTPINVNTVKVDQTDIFKKLLEKESNQRLKDQYTSHLIAGLSYTYIFNNQSLKFQRNFIYVKADVETSGNLLSLLNKTPLMSEVNDYHEIFGIRYSQYVKLGIEFRYYHYISFGNFVFRALAGYGIPYGNSQDMPFEKNYYAGGANGMRGWSYRQLGPGSYRNDQITNGERFGNIQLEFNTEYRFPIYSFLNGALFVDVGNIWNSKPIESFPDSEFKFNTFYKQLAMDMGLGLRLDFSFFLVRLDFAIPFRDPKYDEPERWRFSKWQWKDVGFNFGIGYPF